MNQTTSSLRSDLDAFRDRLGCDQGPGPNPAAGGLLEYLRACEDEAGLAALEQSGMLPEYRRCFGPAVLAFIRAEEEGELARLRSARPDRGETLRDRLGPNRWGAYAGMERALGLVDLGPARTVAMVGCGPVPDSLFCLHDQTDVPRLVGVERDPPAARAAAELVRGLGLHRIEIQLGDAAGLDYSRFDAIFCSVFAEPRLEILERIAASARPGTAVVVRDPFAAGSLVFEPVLDRLPAGLEIRARGEPRRGPLMLTYAALEVR